MEVEAVDEGKVGKILVEEGTDDVAVNTAIAVLLEEGESADDIKPAGADAPAPKAEAAPAKEAPAARQGSCAGSQGRSKVEQSDARARQPHLCLAAGAAHCQAERHRHFVVVWLRSAWPHHQGRCREGERRGRAAEGGCHAGQAGSRTSHCCARLHRVPSDDMVRKLFAEGSYEELPHDGMRKTIASRLSESNATVPSYNISVDCQLDALLKLRGELNKAAPEKDGKPAYKLSVNDFIIKALALALRDVPMANASWTSSARLLHKHSDVGVAVAIPDGLITPIVRRAEEKALSAISAEVKDMAGRARDKKLKPEEYQGGTTAVSNLGMFGVDNFTSIINPPHASIVSIGAGVQKPVVKDGAVAIATVMNATFAFDHRVIDGALGGELATAFRGYVENPMAMLV
jgi:pyruvate dehydrogenase E2 component (dihydrolipoamide acetyltransferase)